MTRYHNTSSGDVAFTPEEEAAYDARDAAFEADKPRQAALTEIDHLEAAITPRRMRDAITDPTWMLAQEALIQIERDKL